MSHIRLATITDLESITEIYNQAIWARFETADTVEFAANDRLDWFQNHSQNNYPIFVYKENGKVLGWLSISPYRSGRQALKYTAEVSCYIHTNIQHQGIGSKLLEYVLKEGKSFGFKTFFAIVLDKNTASANILKKFGFEEWGHLPNVADFDGEECGHLYFGRRI